MFKYTNSYQPTLYICDETFIANQFELFQNYPNPFNPTTTIKYAIPSNDKVEIIIYNTPGQRVKILLNENQEAGFHEMIWDATNDAGGRVGSGIYYYSVEAGEHKAVKKMILLK